MSKYKDIIFGKTKTEAKKEAKVEAAIDELEQKKEELEDSIDQMLAKTGPFNPNHKAFSILMKDRKYQLVEVDIDLSSLQSRVNMLPSLYDSVERAISELQKKLAEQHTKMLREKNK